MNQDNRKKIVAIINPISGTSKKTNLPELVKRTIDDTRFDVEIVFTEAAGHATELAAQAAADGAYAVMAIGGDGTVNEVGRALCDTATAMAIIPCGSGNGLARHLRLPMNVEHALRNVNDAEVIDADYATVNGKPFFCTCGTGFDAKVSHAFAEAGQRGLITYGRTTVAEFFKVKPQKCRIEIDGEAFEEEAFDITCCNASQFGNNCYVAPHATICDGVLDLTIIREITMPLGLDPIVQKIANTIGGDNNTVLRRLLSLPAGIELLARMFTRSLRDSNSVTIRQGQHIVIDRPTADVIHIDGDPTEMPARLQIDIHPKAIKLLVSGNIEKI